MRFIWDSISVIVGNVHGCDRYLHDLSKSLLQILTYEITLISQFLTDLLKYS